MKRNLYALLFSLSVITLASAQVPDSSFSNDGKTILPPNSQYESLSSSLLQPNGKIVIGGYDYDETFYYPSISLWRVNANGSVDESFGSGGHVHISGSPFGGSEYGGYLALQPDNKIVGLGTDFDRDGIIKSRIVLFRLKPNGTYDSSFGKNGKAYTNFGGFTNVAGTLLLKSDGKIVVSGDLQKDNSGIQKVELAQYLSNGRIDSSFGTSGKTESGLPFRQKGIALASLPGNKILAGFQYTQGSTFRTCIARYNADGRLDSSFGRNGIAYNKKDETVYTANMSLAIQGDGKILEYVTGESNNILYRYKANGSLDNTFGDGGAVTLPGGYFTLSVVLDEEQRILVNTSPFSILRYLPDGKPDLSFGTRGKLTTDFTDTIPDSFVQPGKLLIQPDSKIINTGYIDLTNGLQSFALARFKNTSASAIAPVAANAAASSQPVVVYPNPVLNTLHIKGLSENTQYSLSLTDREGNIKMVRQATGASFLNWNVDQLKSGWYFLNVVSAKGKTTVTFLKQ